MNKLSLPQYDLETTLLGGQAFNWDFEDGYFYGFTSTKAIKLKINGEELFWQTYPRKDDLHFLKKYLKLDTDYKKILKKIEKDRYIKSAIKKYPNLRLLNQDFEQTLLSFMISSNNNISSIRKIIRMLNEKFGKSITIDGKKIFLFPRTEVLANAKLDDLLGCKLGFRAKYLKGAAQYILKTELQNKIKKLSESTARNTLKEINGVGDKITDCVLVFSLGFENVTPLDIWGKRFLIQFYKLNPKMKYEEMRAWTQSYFGGYAGWAGQFLYEYIRNL
ncbi:MAG: hypothetical protein HY094_06050 [Candidatus Melainabacteria bacterium]|nr:hypothetical protein [Candidatus Melainabacteria bacterium]